MIRETLSKVCNEYQEAKTELFSGHALANYIRQDIPKLATQSWNLRGLKVVASCGAGRWSSVPWIGLFDHAVTSGAQYGYYLVYLFSEDLTVVYLSLIQGATAVQSEFGSKGATEELTRRAQLMRHRLNGHTVRLNAAPIDLHSTYALPRSYEAAHVLGKAYVVTSLPSEESLNQDLQEAIHLYRILITKGGLTELTDEDIDEADANKLTLLERRHYVAHKTLERNPKAARTVKEAQGTVCKACDFDFQIAYGSIGIGYIEAHHKTPISSIPEGEQVGMDPIDDFDVLCSNCHRMTHKRNPPFTLEELRGILGKAKAS